MSRLSSLAFKALGGAVLLGAIAGYWVGSGHPRAATETTRVRRYPAARRSRAPEAIVALLLLAIAGAIGALVYHLHSTKEAKRVAMTLTRGDPDQGPDLMRQYGCTGCHKIPGVSGPGGLAGPPLQQVAQRVYVGGVVPNTPQNLIQWIVDPKSINPRTAMPITGISETEARHVAAYLYSRK